MSAPAGTHPDALATILARRLRAIDAGLAADVSVSEAAGLDPLDARLVRLYTEEPNVGVLGASRRAIGLLEAVAARTPWRVRAASPETHDPREMTELALRADVAAVLVGAGDPPGPDERGNGVGISLVYSALERRQAALIASIDFRCLRRQRRP